MKLMQLRLFFVCLILATCSCTVEKRVFLRGYNINFPNNDFRARISTSQVEKDFSSTSFLHKKTIITETETSTNFLNEDLIETIHAFDSNVVCQKQEVGYSKTEIFCDTIFLKNGDTITAKNIGYGRMVIKFRYCGCDKNTYTSIQKEDVLIIKYQSGETWDGDKDKTQKREKNTRIEPFTVVALISSVIPYFFFFHVIGIALAISAVVLSFIGLKKIRKEKEKYHGNAIGIIALIFAFGYLLIYGFLIISILLAIR
jgi:hypothetical protein